MTYCRTTVVVLDAPVGATGSTLVERVVVVCDVTTGSRSWQPVSKDATNATAAKQESVISFIGCLIVARF